MFASVALVAILAAGVASAQQVWRPGDPARGASLAAGCAACHGEHGAAPLPGMPALASQQPEFIMLQLVLMREGLRDVPAMTGTLKGLTDRDLVDIATYYGAARPFRSPPARDPALYARGETLSKAMGCNSCHMGDYSGQRQVPRLVNQREDYLAAALRAYRDDRRSGTDTSMNAVMYKAVDADIAAIAHYLAQRTVGPAEAPSTAASPGAGSR
ncbi:MAG: c-type cytochrome [Betaproteobacteria bacterium]|nr:c-type cytochrome [Betaproteobacteria bacterium]